LMLMRLQHGIRGQLAYTTPTPKVLQKKRVKVPPSSF